MWWRERERERERERKIRWVLTAVLPTIPILIVVILTIPGPHCSFSHQPESLSRDLLFPPPVIVRQSDAETSWVPPSGRGLWSSDDDYNEFRVSAVSDFEFFRVPTRNLFLSFHQYKK